MPCRATPPRPRRRFESFVRSVPGSSRVRSGTSARAREERHGLGRVGGCRRPGGRVMRMSACHANRELYSDAVGRQETKSSMASAVNSTHRGEASTDRLVRLFNRTTNCLALRARRSPRPAGSPGRPWIRTTAPPLRFLASASSSRALERAVGFPSWMRRRRSVVEVGAVVLPVGPLVLFESEPPAPTGSSGTRPSSAPRPCPRCQLRPPSRVARRGVVDRGARAADVQEAVGYGRTGRATGRARQGERC